MWKAIGLALLFCAACSAQAAEWIGTNQFIRTENERLDQETWIGAQQITVRSEAADDLFAAGTAVELSGIFRGDVWAGGSETVQLSGRFHDHVRALAKTVQVSGTLHQSLTAAGSRITITPETDVAGSVHCAGESVTCEATVRGNMHLAAQKITLGGQVNGDVFITAQDIVLLPYTQIDGNLTYTAPNELLPASSVGIGGELIRRPSPVPQRPILKPDLAGHAGFAIAALLTGLVFSALFPTYTSRSVQLLRTARGPCVLTGFAALFLIPIASLMMMLTFIGLPLGLLTAGFYAILLYLSKLITAFWVGSVLLKRDSLTRQNRFRPLAAGLLVFYVLTAFTILSTPVHLLAALFGLGALILALFKKPVLVIQTEQETTEE